MKNLTLIIPAKNESESLPLVLEELKEYNLKTKVILSSEDKSTINSIRKYDVEIVFQKNKGWATSPPFHEKAFISFSLLFPYTPSLLSYT